MQKALPDQFQSLVEFRLYVLEIRRCVGFQSVGCFFHEVSVRIWFWRPILRVQIVVHNLSGLLVLEILGMLLDILNVEEIIFGKRKRVQSVWDSHRFSAFDVLAELFYGVGLIVGYLALPSRGSDVLLGVFVRIIHLYKHRATWAQFISKLFQSFTSESDCLCSRAHL